MGSTEEKFGKYDDALVTNIMGNIETTTFQRNHREVYETEFSKCSPHIKQQIYKTQQQNSDSIQNNYHALISGDDDRLLNHSKYAARNMDGYNRMDNNGYLPFKALSRTSSGKYKMSAFQNCDIDHNSYLRDIINNSDASAKSQKSSKTVASHKSSHDLKKLIKSQCKFNKEIEEILKGISNIEPEIFCVHDACSIQEDPSHLLPFGLNQCKNNFDHLNLNKPQKGATTEIEKGACRTISIPISVDDVINARFIIPMIHKLNRMYLNNLKEEMALMEDLELLPNKVNEVYKSITN